MGAYNPDAPTQLDAIARTLISYTGRRGALLRNKAGMTPLHLAALHGNTRMITLLMRNRADINAQDTHGNTPLHFAATEQAIKLLLRLGANVSMINHHGTMAMLPQIS